MMPDEKDKQNSIKQMDAEPDDQLLPEPIDKPETGRNDAMNTEDDSGPSATKRKMSDGMKGRYRKGLEKISRRVVITHLNKDGKKEEVQSPLKHIGIADIVSGRPFNVLQAVAALRDDAASPLETDLADWMFRAWMASPLNGKFHSDALAAFVRSHIDKIENRKHHTDYYDAWIKIAYARISQKNMQFYQYVYDLVGEKRVRSAISASNLSSKAQHESRWWYEIVILYMALHNLYVSGEKRKISETISAFKAALLVRATTWRPQLSDFTTIKTVEKALQQAAGMPKGQKRTEEYLIPAVPNQDLTIRRDLKKAWPAAPFVYAAYMTQGRTEDNIIDLLPRFGQRSKIDRDVFLAIFDRAAFVINELTPKSENFGWFPAAAISETSVEPVPPAVMTPDEINELTKALNSQEKR